MTTILAIHGEWRRLDSSCGLYRYGPFPLRHLLVGDGAIYKWSFLGLILVGLPPTTVELPLQHDQAFPQSSAYL